MAEGSDGQVGGGCEAATEALQRSPSTPSLACTDTPYHNHLLLSATDNTTPYRTAPYRLCLQAIDVVQAVSLAALHLQDAPHELDVFGL